MGSQITSIKFVYILGLLVLMSAGCKCPENNDPGDQFDRSTMLTDWIDINILPSYTAYLPSLVTLKEASDQFFSVQDDVTFTELKAAYLSAYKAWQFVSLYDIGMAEEIGLRNYTNIYPTNEETILGNITSQDADLSLPSNFVAQGFPALDFLLYGIAETETEVMDLLLQDNYKDYTIQLISRLIELTTLVLDDWNGEYRATFIANDGSSATASVDKMVNDYLFYYEKYVRAGKVALPAGVFTGTELPHLVEAPYSRIYSKDLLNLGLLATLKFFNGESIDGQTFGISLVDYLDQVHGSNAVSDISKTVNDQWPVIQEKITVLDNDLYGQVETDNTKMLQVYDEMQKNVITLKVDMMQALNIQVDYVDADGD